MRKLKTCVTYEIVTPESAEYGECDESGFIITKEDNRNLRECIKEVLKTRTNLMGGTESIYASINVDSIDINVCNNCEYETGSNEYRTLHIAGITQASAKRLAKLLNVKLTTSW